MTNNQFIRKVSLIVYGTPPTPTGTGLPIPGAPATAGPAVFVPGTTGATNQLTIPNSKPQAAQDQRGTELGDLRIQFSITAIDVDTPPTAHIRVINLSDAVAQQIQQEFSGVTLQAGYANGNFGVIFQGTIVRVVKGRLSNIDTFVEILASNFDLLYNYGFVNKTIAKGSSAQDRANALAAAATQAPAIQSAEATAQNAQTQGWQYGYISNSFGTGGVLPRGKVMFGLARKYMNHLTDTKGCTWSIQPDGKVKIIAFDDYLPNTAVVINAQTGMVGIPQATQQGIKVSCLLNPNIQTGQLIKLDNASINTTTNRSNIGFPAYSDFEFFANTSNDGIYRALVVEHEGDSRGEGADWLTTITALAVDKSAPPNSSTQVKVAAYG